MALNESLVYTVTYMEIIVRCAPSYRAVVSFLSDADLNEEDREGPTGGPPCRVSLVLEVSAGMTCTPGPVVEGGDCARGPSEELKTAGWRESPGGALYHGDLVQER